MSYLTDAVTEISTAAKNAAFLHVQGTDLVDINHSWDAHKIAKRFYRKENGFHGEFHCVAEEVDDGWNVMLMEEA